MGQRSARNAEFLRKHPICCFCGGTRPATTLDHIPARSIFFRRQWPEGYVFPACAECNEASRDDERLMAMAVRLRLTSDVTEEEEKELEKAVAGVAYRFPDFTRKFKEVSRVKTRQYMRERGFPSTTLPGVGEIYIVEPPPEMFEAIDRYGVKLAKALHYLHTGRIAPLGAAVQCRTITNGALMKQDFPSDVLSLLNAKPSIIRHHSPLDRQFTYRFGIVDEQDAAGYWVHWGESAAMLLAVFFDGARYEQAMAQRRAADAIEAV